METPKYVRLMTVVILSIALAGCSGGKKESSESSVQSKPPVPVEISAVTEADLMEGIDAVGQLSPKFEAELRSEVTGIVSKVYVNEWVKVSKGAPLIALDSRELDALVNRTEAELIQAKVRFNKAVREYERHQKLKDAGLVTQQNLDDALTEKQTAESAIKSAEESLRHAQARLSKTVIHSPIDGVIASRNVNAGDLVGEPGAQKVLFRIVDNRILNLTVRVPSKEMSAVKVGQSLVFTTDAFPGETFKGKIMYINPAVDESDRSVRVIAEVANVNARLKGGLFVKGRILTVSRTKSLTVPSSALISWDMSAKKAEVFIMEKDAAVKKTVVTGLQSKGVVEILSGLAKGDMLITRGAFNVKEGDKVTVIKQGE